MSKNPTKSDKSRTNETTPVFDEIRVVELKGTTFGIFRARDRIYTGRKGKNGHAFAAAIPVVVAKRFGVKVGTVKGEGVGAYKGWVYTGPVSAHTGRVYPGTISEKAATKLHLL